jgi:hypothetical protein
MGQATIVKRDRKRMLLWAGLLVVQHRRTLLLLLALLVLAGVGCAVLQWLTASSDYVTMESLSTIEAGMKMEQVETLFGGPGKESLTDPILGPAAAKLFTCRDLCRGTGMFVYGTSWSGTHGGNISGAGNWRTWHGRQGNNRVIVAVCFDRQGRAIKTVGYELIENSLFDRIRGWLGI